MSARLALALVVAAASASSAAFVACGGTVEAVPIDHDDGSASDGASSADGATSGDDASTITDGNGGGGSCPSAAPTVGAPCPRAKLVCEYGGEGDHLLCTTTFTCDATGTWSATGGDAGCVATPAEDPAACPASFGALAPGSACPAGLTTHCLYAEGPCGCGSCIADGGGGSLWACRTWSTAPTGCAFPRPRLGTACTTEGKECDYATVCTPVSEEQPDMKCEGGIWVPVPVPQPPCSVPRCGP